MIHLSESLLFIYYSQGLFELCTKVDPEQFLRKILDLDDNSPQSNATLSIIFSIPVDKFIENLLCARQWAKPFTCIIPFKAQQNLME